ncbi:uncharacterized protein N7483_007686 [Penicillium malachiteum]|uniref:uncharacterized protein n=1 Tax=Penicillium malachiteum TaxID=1324776 RepID=UPI0025471945|nr:uncharacterized protein N7483_007686 [Penicillium malachiteum]KAJ5726329.1 hypothetical protein N7483_007686 [Penicillium malachiteum]
MNMPPIFNRFRTVLSRRGKKSSISFLSKESIWKCLPNDVLVRLVSLCELEDIVSLALTCRLIHSRVFKNETAISHVWLNIRRRNYLRDEDDLNFSPGDDLTFISELFPPPPPQYAVGDGHDDAEYSFAYLADLQGCWTTCIQLSYHLADHAVRHHLDTDPIARSLWTSSKTEKEVVYSRAVAVLHEKLIYPMAHTILFLESSAADDPISESSVHLDRLFKSIDDQRSILQSTPFTNTHILLSTQHCLELLCSTLRRLMLPEFPSSSSENWVSMLLMTSTLERILKFFVAVAKDEEERESPFHATGWSHRKEFMWRMREDLSQYVVSKKYSNRISTGLPTLTEVWFGACHQEMLQRGAVPHSTEEPVPVLHGSAVKLTCEYCYIEE